jgi:hypothetical protein
MLKMDTSEELGLLVLPPNDFASLEAPEFPETIKLNAFNFALGATPRPPRSFHPFAAIIPATLVPWSPDESKGVGSVADVLKFHEPLDTTFSEMSS